MADQLVGGFNKVGKDAALNANIADQSRSALIGNLAGKIDANTQATNVQNAVPAQMNAETQNPAQQQKQQLTHQVNNLRQYLQQNSDSLDPQSKSAFSQLVSGIDPQGNLIPRGMDALGNSIQRTVDQQGNMQTASFDSAGSLVGRSVINIGQTLLAASGRVQLSHQPQRGIASPYAQTRG